MGNADVASSRNFALIGHGGDGKTSLGESLLHRAGVLETPGSVDDASSTLNYLPEEKWGHHAPGSSPIFSFDWSGPLALWLASETGALPAAAPGF